MYRLIKDEDLSRFYELQGGSGQPVGSGVFTRRDYAWLDELKLQAEAIDSKTCHLELSLSGLSCVGCVWLIESLFKKMSGGMSCRIDVQRGLMRIEWIRRQFDWAVFRLWNLAIRLGGRRCEPSVFRFRLDLRFLDAGRKVGAACGDRAEPQSFGSL